MGIFKNCFGDASALVQRAVFEALRGFTEDAGVGHEDWELWARAVLHGYKLQVVLVERLGHHPNPTPTPTPTPNPDPDPDPAPTLTRSCS